MLSYDKQVFDKELRFKNVIIILVFVMSNFISHILPSSKHAHVTTISKNKLPFSTYVYMNVNPQQPLHQEQPNNTMESVDSDDDSGLLLTTATIGPTFTPTKDDRRYKTGNSGENSVDGSLLLTHQWRRQTIASVHIDHMDPWEVKRLFEHFSAVFAEHDAACMKQQQRSTATSGGESTCTTTTNNGGLQTLRLGPLSSARTSGLRSAHSSQTRTPSTQPPTPAATLNTFAVAMFPTTAIAHFLAGPQRRPQQQQEGEEHEPSRSSNSNNSAAPQQPPLLGLMPTPHRNSSCGQNLRALHLYHLNIVSLRPLLVGDTRSNPTPMLQCLEHLSIVKVGQLRTLFSDMPSSLSSTSSSSSVDVALPARCLPRLGRIMLNCCFALESIEGLERCPSLHTLVMLYCPRVERLVAAPATDDKTNTTNTTTITTAEPYNAVSLTLPTSASSSAPPFEALEHVVCDMLSTCTGLQRSRLTTFSTISYTLNTERVLAAAAQAMTAPPPPAPTPTTTTTAVAAPAVAAAAPRATPPAPTGIAAFIAARTGGTAAAAVTAPPPAPAVAARPPATPALVAPQTTTTTTSRPSSVAAAALAEIRKTHAATYGKLQSRLKDLHTLTFEWKTTAQVGKEEKSEESSSNNNRTTDQPLLLTTTTRLVPSPQRFLTVVTVSGSGIASLRGLSPSLVPHLRELRADFCAALTSFEGLLPLVDLLPTPEGDKTKDSFYSTSSLYYHTNLRRISCRFAGLTSLRGLESIRCSRPLPATTQNEQKKEEKKKKTQRREHEEEELSDDEGQDDGEEEEWGFELDISFNPELVGTIGDTTSVVSTTTTQPSTTAGTAAPRTAVATTRPPTTASPNYSCFYEYPADQRHSWWFYCAKLTAAHCPNITALCIDNDDRHHKKKNHFTRADCNDDDDDDVGFSSTVSVLPLRALDVSGCTRLTSITTTAKAFRNKVITTADANTTQVPSGGNSEEDRQELVAVPVAALPALRLLNTTNCPQLHSIHAGGPLPQLRDLCLAQCPALSILRAYLVVGTGHNHHHHSNGHASSRSSFPRVERLDITDNTAIAGVLAERGMTFPLLKVLRATGSSITDLHFLRTSAALQELHIHHCRSLATLDGLGAAGCAGLRGVLTLTGCTNLRSLTGLCGGPADMPLLTAIDAWDVPLQSLDGIERCTGLERVEVADKWRSGRMDVFYNVA